MDMSILLSLKRAKFHFSRPTILEQRNIICSYEHGSSKSNVEDTLCVVIYASTNMPCNFETNDEIFSLCDSPSPNPRAMLNAVLGAQAFDLSTFWIHASDGTLSTPIPILAHPHNLPLFDARGRRKSLRPRYHSSPLKNSWYTPPATPRGVCDQFFCSGNTPGGPFSDSQVMVLHLGEECLCDECCKIGLCVTKPMHENLETKSNFDTFQFCNYGAEHTWLLAYDRIGKLRAHLDICSPKTSNR